jgi:hypothetical protein
VRIQLGTAKNFNNFLYFPSLNRKHPSLFGYKTRKTKEHKICQLEVLKHSCSQATAIQSIYDFKTRQKDLGTDQS